MATTPSPCRVILEVSFECDVCEQDTPARDAHRARLDGPFGPLTVDVCPDCYRDGIDDGIIEPALDPADLIPFCLGTRAVSPALEANRLRTVRTLATRLMMIALDGGQDGRCGRAIAT